MVALNHGRTLLELIRAVHERLLSGVRGESEAPGRGRSIQNYIGHGADIARGHVW